MASLKYIAENTVLMGLMEYLGIGRKRIGPSLDSAAYHGNGEHGYHYISNPELQCPESVAAFLAKIRAAENRLRLDGNGDGSRGTSFSQLLASIKTTEAEMKSCDTGHFYDHAQAPSDHQGYTPNEDGKIIRTLLANNTAQPDPAMFPRHIENTFRILNDGKPPLGEYANRAIRSLFNRTGRRGLPVENLGAQPVEKPSENYTRKSLGAYFGGKRARFSEGFKKTLRRIGYEPVPSLNIAPHLETPLSYTSAGLISLSARKVCSYYDKYQLSENAINALRDRDHDYAARQLMSLSGVGIKTAKHILTNQLGKKEAEIDDRQLRRIYMSVIKGPEKKYRTIELFNQAYEKPAHRAARAGRFAAAFGLSAALFAMLAVGSLSHNAGKTEYAKSVAAYASPVKVKSPSESGPRPARIHTVKKWSPSTPECLWNIAKYEYGLKKNSEIQEAVEKLREKNKGRYPSLESSDTIHPGWVLELWN